MKNPEEPRHGGIGAVIDIPDMAILEWQTLGELVEEFSKRWGQRPDAVALPILTEEGPCFVTELAPPLEFSYKGKSGTVLLPELASMAVSEGMDIYLVIEPALGFINSDTIHVKDIVGDMSAHACVGNPKTREILKLFTEDALQQVELQFNRAGKRKSGAEHGVAGLVIDAVDLWPMGAEGDRVELTCFCKHCVRHLSQSIDLAAFQTFPNPWNLGLRDTGTGIAHIDEFEPESTPDDILKMSRMKNFTETLVSAGHDESQLNWDALNLRRYLLCRDAQTRQALGDLLSVAKTSGRDLSRVILTEGSRYNWTAGAFLACLDDPELCDELWFDPASLESNTSRVPWRAYMWRRARYGIDAFFSQVARSQEFFTRMFTGLAELPADAVESLLSARRTQALAGEMPPPVSLFTLPDDQPMRAGFVAPVLSENVLEALQIRRKRGKTLHDLSPPKRATPRKKRRKK